MFDHPAHSNHGSHDEFALADQLDREAAAFADALDTVVKTVEDHLPAAPRTVVDLGAGTGAGSLRLARRFPHATITAIDSSPLMLERLHTSAAQQGTLARIHTVQADLDTSWPDVGTVDLAWAALSLHHLAQPAVVMDRVRSAIRPDGLVVVIELDDVPQFLPDDFRIIERLPLSTDSPSAAATGHDHRNRIAWVARPPRPHNEGTP